MASTNLMFDLWANYFDGVRKSIDYGIGPLVDKLESDEKTDAGEWLGAVLKLAYKTTWGFWDALLGLTGSPGHGVVFEVSPNGCNESKAMPLYIANFDTKKLTATPLLPFFHSQGEHDHGAHTALADTLEASYESGTLVVTLKEWASANAKKGSYLGAVLYESRVVAFALVNVS